MWRFKEGQLVERIGHTTRYRVIGYNFANGVITIREDLKDNFANREIFRENELKKVKKFSWF